MLGMMVLLLAALGAVLLDDALGGWGVLVGALAGAGAGVLVILALRRRDPRT